jgi:glycosyltransferase involved in cell wall biosynthesis
MQTLEQKTETRSALSIVIPTFQEGGYIGATLAWLRRVSYLVPLETIVVDGGSTDNTIQVAKAFADKVLKTRRGISKARNLGARSARCNVIVFLDADVDLPSNAVQRILKVFEDHEIVGATCRIMPSHSGMLERAFFAFYNGLLRAVCRVRAHSRGEFLAVRKSAFLAVGGFDENLPCLEDHDLAFRLSKVGRFAFVNDLTVYESMRRFRKLGIGEVVGTWFVDYLYYLVRGKPLSMMWKPIR